MSECKGYFFTSFVTTVMKSTEMNQGLKEDFLCIWNVENLEIWVHLMPWWALNNCGQAGYLMYYENNIENQLYLHVINFFTRGSSWKKLKNAFYQKKFWICVSYILIHQWETILTAILLIGWRLLLLSKLCFFAKRVLSFHSLCLAACMFSSNTSLITNSAGGGSIVVILKK